MALHRNIAAIGGGLLLLVAGQFGDFAMAQQATTDTTQAAREFVAQYEQTVRPLEIAEAKAWWQANITGKDEDFAAKEAAENKVNEALSNPKTFNELKHIKAGRIDDPLLAHLVFQRATAEWRLPIVDRDPSVPLSETVPVAPYDGEHNYFWWLLQASRADLAARRFVDAGGSVLTPPTALLFVVLRHALLAALEAASIDTARARGSVWAARPRWSWAGSSARRTCRWRWSSTTRRARAPDRRGGCRRPAPRPGTVGRRACRSCNRRPRRSRGCSSTDRARPRGGRAGTCPPRARSR